MVIISYPLPSFAERYRDASVHTHARTHTYRHVLWRRIGLLLLRTGSVPAAGTAEQDRLIHGHNVLLLISVAGSGTAVAGRYAAIDAVRASSGGASTVAGAVAGSVGVSASRASTRRTVGSTRGVVLLLLLLSICAVIPNGVHGIGPGMLIAIQIINTKISTTNHWPYCAERRNLNAVSA